jgi:integrase
MVTLARRLKAQGKEPEFHGVTAVLPSEPGSELLPLSIGIDIDRPQLVSVFFSANSAPPPVERTHRTEAAIGENFPLTTLSSVGARSFRDVVRDYIEDQQDNWTTKTKAEIEAIFRLVGTALPEIPFRSIDKAVLRKVHAMLRRLPPGCRKSPLFRHLVLPEILALQDRRERTGIARFVMPGTANKWWGWLKALFNWAVINKDTNVNYARAVRVRVQRKLGRRGFTDSELRDLFSGSHFRPGGYQKASQYWGPVLSYYGGLRCNELGQTPLKAVKRDPRSGVLWIDIRRELGFVLKNDYGERELPIHPHIAESLWTYVERLRSMGEHYLFPDLPHGGRDGPGRGISRYVNETLLPSIGLKSQELVLHSTRHSLVSRLEAAGVEDKWVRRIVGHRVKTALATYAGKHPHDVLLKHLVRARWPARPPAFQMPNS